MFWKGLERLALKFLESGSHGLGSRHERCEQRGRVRGALADFDTPGDWRIKTDHKHQNQTTNVVLGRSGSASVTALADVL